MMSRICFLFIIILFTACSGIHKISNTNLSYQYRQSNNVLQPEYVVHHFSNDSSRLYIKIPVKEILYRKNDAGEMQSLLNVRLMFFPAYEDKNFFDSISFTFSPHYTLDSSAYVLKHVDFKKPFMSCLLAIKLNDLQRGSFKESFLEINIAQQSQQYFLWKETVSDIPLFTPYADNTITLKLESLQPDKKIYCRQFNQSFPLALPPFSNKSPQKFSYNSSSTLLITADNVKDFSFRQKAIYHFQYDTLIREGASLLIADQDYPLMTNASSLVEALRYLTTSSEYNKMVNATDKKEAIDRFWLEVSGSKERARTLIKTFYNRVQNANRFFTSYLEGWKSDRGMIYVVFGPPATVYKTSEAEYWDYGNYKGFGSLNFTFKKIKNPFTINDFILVRLSSYEPVWYLAVDNWRQGRITTEE